MANTQRARGFAPWGEVRRISSYICGAAVYPGDLLEQNASGQVVPATNGSGLAKIGVCAQYSSASGKAVDVWDHPDQFFVVGSDGTNPTNQAGLFFNYDVTATAGDATAKISRHQLASASKATTASLPLKALAIDPRPDNALGSSFCDVVVQINNHVLQGGTGQVGV